MANLLKTIRRNLHRHIDVVAREIGERNSYKYTALERAYNYILDSMRQSSLQIKEYNYRYKNHIFRNIIAEKIGIKYPKEIIIIGAHYDTAHNTPGADDNASGVAALLEFIRLFDDYNNKRTVRFVAFTLEEPPFHGTPQMGSYIYAKSCKKRHENIIMMISLEMLAYFSSKRHSQKFPHPDMVTRYPDRGNFVSVVGNDNSKIVVKKISIVLNHYSSVPAYGVITNPFINGAELSDHAPFWNFGYRAVMITDTAFYRNPHYHQPNDTIDTLNFDYFSKLVLGLYHSFKKLDLEGI